MRQRQRRAFWFLASPFISLMLLSLILPAVLLASEAMAANYTFAYIPGFFAQDDPNANASAIGPVSETRRAERAERLKPSANRQL